MNKKLHTPGPWLVETVPTACGICHKVGPFPGKRPEDKPRHACLYADYPSKGNPADDELEANARLIAAAPDLLEACQTFAEWLRREDAGFDHKTHNRETPEGEAAWREWFYGNIAICGLAQEQARAAIAKATGETA